MMSRAAYAAMEGLRVTEPDLGRRSIAASLWFIFGSGGQLVLQFVFFVVLARLLGPRPFGIISIASILIDILVITGRFGVVEVLVQRPDMNEDIESIAFWVTLLFGLVASIIVYFSAPLLSDFYQLSEVGVVLKWLAPTCVINATCAVYEAKLRRKLDFKWLAVRNVLASVIGYVVAIAMAYYSFGIYSLIMQRIIVVVIFALFVVVQSKWAPKFTFDRKEATRICTAGISIVSISLLGVWNQKIIDLIISIVLGPISLGFLRIAWRGPDILQQVSLQALIPVAMSSLSRIGNENERFKKAYERIVNATAIIMYPLYAGLIIFADDFIEILFGDRWQNSVSPMRILCLTGFIAPLFYYNGIAMIAKGRNQLVLAVNAFEFLISAACAAVMAREGLDWAAASNIVRGLIFVPFSMWFAKKELELPPLGTFRSCWKAGVGALLFMAFGFASKFTGQSYMPRLALDLIVGTLGLLIYAVFIAYFESENMLYFVARSPVRHLPPRFLKGLAKLAGKTRV